jgi:DNA-binding transcriptional LysR family regulator
MDRLDAMSVLVTVCETGSLSAAGRKLGMPLATVSRKVGDLEAHLGTRLLVRSTRKLTLTEAGTTYLEASKRILEEINEVERAAAGEFETPRGELQITAPVVFGRLHLLPLVNEFLANFPEVSVRLALSDRNLHFTDDHVDVALRIGALPDSSLMSLKLGAVRRVIVGSFSYFAERGTPKTPGDLAGHAVINFEALASGTTWNLASAANRRQISFNFRPRLSVTAAEAAIDAAIAGVVITRVLSYQVAAAVNDRRLRCVLHAYEPEPSPVNLLYLGQGPIPLKLRRFIDFATPRLREKLEEIDRQVQPVATPK